MPRKAAVQLGHGSSRGLIAGHDIAKHPALSNLLLHALDTDIVSTTRRGYSSAVRSYVDFCSVREIADFPVTEQTLGAFMLRKMTTVSPNSLPVYLAGIRRESDSRGLLWNLEGSVTIRRVFRYIKRTFPSKQGSAKLAVSLDMLMTMLPLLPGWPDLGALGHNDLLFASSSIIGVLGLLRGGEFTFRKDQARPLLRRCDIQPKVVHGKRAIIVAVRQPKNCWWQTELEVVIFQGPPGSPFCPCALYDALCARSPGARPTCPAFQFQDGAPLTRKWLLERTVGLVTMAGISMVDQFGNNMTIKLASFRAGGLRSSINAKNAEPILKLQGRWRSDAWKSYWMN